MSFKDFSLGQKSAKPGAAADKPAAASVKPDAKPAGGTPPAK
ncbi:MAG: hypothetical protein RIA64_09185 [Rhodospirillales bacterium]